MDRPGEIGSTIVIKGDITAAEDLVISGRVEGSIVVAGHVLRIGLGAEVMGEVQARAIVVCGKAFGKLSADERLDLQETADVEAELSAPALRIADGAIFNGKAETKNGARSKLQLAS